MQRPMDRQTRQTEKSRNKGYLVRKNEFQREGVEVFSGGNSPWTHFPEHLFLDVVILASLSF